jgi:hypothetical protein
MWRSLSLDLENYAMKIIRGLSALAGVLALGSVIAYAAGNFGTLPPAGGAQYPATIPLTGNETIPADTNLASGAQPQSEIVSTAQIGSYLTGLPSRGNALIGGDATTNLFQRGTTGASETTTYAYGGPDRWAYWSGTSTAMTVSRDSTASDIAAGVQYAFKMARTSGQTGVVQVCMAQEVESANSYQFQGSTAELDFRAYTGANYSATLANMTAYIVYGTGTDEGMQKLAWGLNGGGGGSVGWTGQTNATAAVISLGAVSTAGRYAAVASIPATATEIGVALCYTPVGTAGTNDYIAFSDIQLIRNPANAAYASATVGYSAASFPAASFERRPQATETLYQSRYTYSINEGTITAGAIMASGGNTGATTTTCSIMIPFPVTMRAAPTYANALTASTFKLVSASQTATALSTPFSATLGANTVQNGSINFTTTGMTAKDGCYLVSAAGSGQMLFSSEL